MFQKQFLIMKIFICVATCSLIRHMIKSEDHTSTYLNRHMYIHAILICTMYISFFQEFDFVDCYWKNKLLYELLCPSVGWLVSRSVITYWNGREVTLPTLLTCSLVYAYITSISVHRVTKIFCIHHYHLNGEC